MEERQTSLILYTMMIATVLTCCGKPQFNPTTPVDPGDKPTQGDAYLYGRFELSNYAYRWHNGFVIGCKDGREYTIPFELGHDDAVIAIKIAPSTCVLRGIVYGSSTEGVKRDDAIARSMSSMEFAAGNAYYLGDFFVGQRTMTEIEAKPEDSAYPRSFATKTVTRMKLERVEDDYEKTTYQLKRRLPNFREVPVVKRLLDDAVLPPEIEYSRGLDHAKSVAQCLKAADECRAGCNSNEDRKGCISECKKQESACK